MVDFDHVPERRGTNSLKYNFAKERGYPTDVLPLWVADMDFPAPQSVLDALHGAVDHGIFGYSEVKAPYFNAAAAWFRKHFEYELRPEWLVKTPGVIYALAAALRGLTEPGDKVLIQPPVYYPFFTLVRDNGRCVVESELEEKDGRYEIDFDDFEAKIREQGVKLFLLCSPHNPMGRIWTGEELRRMGQICARYGVIVVSDEIHCDFAFPEHPHTLILQACPEMQELAVMCTAASKTFNLAGLQVSNIWIPNEELRARFRREIDRTGYSQSNALGLIATQAAYEGGEAWLAECKAYLRGNLDYFRTFLKERLPELRLIEPDGTYFAFVDFSGLGMTGPELDDFIVHKAHLWLDAGHIFGACTATFQRFVLACPRATLTQALEQLEAAVQAIR